ncbi:hypothetical protein IGI37_000739 [Enterococcus sp. AZ194]|uniref:GntR family transcriptional regulator n=1 Tax=Enterococcus sp. AZ194 TaxID=2774629 RepID=UPI003F257E90
MEIKNNQTVAYEQIKEMIMTNQLHPGQKISKNNLVKVTGIGDTPVREAILELQKDGLLLVVPQSGTYVSKIKLAEVDQARFVRENIEKLILTEVCDVIDDTQLAALDTMLAEQQVSFNKRDTSKYFTLDEEFHKNFYIITEKPYIWNWLQVLNIALNRYRFLRLDFEDLGWDNILEEHQNIVQQIKNKDKDKLAEAISQHIHKVEEDSRIVVDAFPNYFER